MAEFYRRIGRSGSAAFYYERVKRGCPDAPLARQAEANLESLRRQAAKQGKASPEDPSDKDKDTPILPPLEPGKKLTCAGPPDQATILRALPRVAKSVPGVYEESREDVEFTVNKLVDRIDPPRFYPLVGPAQLHHCHYKCVVSFNETVKVSWPFAFECKRRRSEVVYIDRDHLHLVREADWFGKRP